MERTVAVDGECAFDALADPGTLEGTDRVARDPAPDAVAGPPPRVRPGDTYVGVVDVPVGDAGQRGALDADVMSFESQFTVEALDSGRLVLSGGGDADGGSFDARVDVAVADVPEGAVVRVDATMDVAGPVAAVGAEPMRAAAAAVLDRYLSGIERVAA